eukprot:5487451-Prymnesium_polylepis.1
MQYGTVCCSLPRRVRRERINNKIFCKPTCPAPLFHSRTGPREFRHRPAGEGRGKGVHALVTDLVVAE